VARLAAALAAGALLASAAAVADRQSDLDALRGAIEAARERVAVYEREQRGLLEAIEALDLAAELLDRDVAAAHGAAERARRERGRVEAEAGDLEVRLAATRRAMRARSVALYRAGELGSLRVLFSADGLPDFLSRVSDLRRLLDRDADLLERSRAQAAALEKARAEAAAAAVRLGEAEAHLTARQAELDAERGRKRAVVMRLHADRAGQRAALVELERAARALEETLAGFEAGAAGPELPAPDAGFARLRHQLPAPVDAPITRGFGREIDPEFKTETFHAGVVFAAPAGAPVAAVAPGRVRYAGWFRGFGRIAILDHGEGWFSVSGHLDELAVAAGDAVGAGHRIGTVGETGSLAGPRLYFEIRHRGEAVDPADWLRPADAR
jgi:septal ring factor EnvC (AmiA/AmiB activator)